MMKPLRKRHLQIWLAWAVLIPAGIVFAWLAIPDTAPVKLLQSPAIDLLPLIRGTSDKKDYIVNLRANTDKSQWQLEWKNKAPLMVPSAVIYEISPNPSFGGTGGGFQIKDASLIGRIEARGDYVFELPKDSLGYKRLDFILYDFIHEKIIDSITIKSLPGGEIRRVS